MIAVASIDLGYDGKYFVAQGTIFSDAHAVGVAGRRVRRAQLVGTEGFDEVLADRLEDLLGDVAKVICGELRGAWDDRPGLF